MPSMRDACCGQPIPGLLAAAPFMMEVPTHSTGRSEPRRLAFTRGGSGKSGTLARPCAESVATATLLVAVASGK